jgi:hypothetical protein
MSIEVPDEVKKFIHDQADQLTYDEFQPPICDLYGWAYMPGMGIILADRFENHPRLGSGHDIQTTKCLMFNRELKMAITKNTAYRLHDEAK